MNIFNFNKIDKKNLSYFLILLGLIYSLLNSVIDTNKYDKFYFNSKNIETHHILKGDTKRYWLKADEFKKDIEIGKSFINSGGTLFSSYLYPRFIAAYYLVINKDILDIDNKLILSNFKFGIPILQSLIYYLTLLIFFKFFQKRIPENILFLMILFLSLEPSILQYHSTYWTESIYFSMNLILFILLYDPPKKTYLYLLIGIFLGIMFLQRTNALYLIFPIILYLIIILKFQSIKKVILILAGFSMIIFFITYENYKKSNVAYFIPYTQSQAAWHYISHVLNAKKFDISVDQAYQKKVKEKKDWIIENNINLNNTKDLLKLGSYEKKYFLKSLDDNYLNFIKIHFYKSLQSLIIPIFAAEKFYIRDTGIETYQEYNFKKLLKLQIFYSIILYIIIFIGMCKLLYSSEKKSVILLILLIIITNLGVLGWVGNGRYLLPNHIFYSVFFANGLSYLFNKLGNYKKKL
tara:strand:+ start:869 stop:2260 length:1392 start_codon:yes stop_codon:yes gene_type:complete